MIVRDSIKIELVWKVNTDAFQKLNPDLFGTAPKRLGPSMSLVQKMVSYYEDMQAMLLPTIISASPKDDEWQQKVKNYWDSISPAIPMEGRILEIGFEYELNNNKVKANIETLIKELGVKVETDEALANLIKTKVPDELKYKYAKPINVEDYLFYIYCLNHRKVANKVEDANNSTNIEFILVDQRLVEETKRRNHTVRMKAKQKFIEILADRKLVSDILYILNKDASLMSPEDQDIEVSNFADAEPQRFLNVIEDTSLKVRARVERYILAGVLEKLPNSSIIVDANDKSVTIGMSIDEAVAYFKSETPERQVKVSEFANRYKALKSNKEKTE